MIYFWLFVFFYFLYKCFEDQEVTKYIEETKNIPKSYRMLKSRRHK